MFKCLALLFFISSGCCYAQLNKKLKNIDVTPLPVIYYAPETRLGLGAASIFVFRLNPLDTFTRKSNIGLHFSYTVNKQIFSDIWYTIFFKQEKYRIDGQCAYYYFPEFYYGIGNNLPLTNQDTITYRWLRFFNKTERKVAPGLFMGLAYEYVDMSNVKGKPGNTLDQTKPAGYEGSAISGIGPSVTYDTRDNVLNATKGSYLDFNSLTYDKYTGSNFNFEKIRIDLRHFKTVWQKYRHVLALQAYGVFAPGNTPFIHLGQLGGEVITRGYYPGRYRNRYFMACQAEYRFPVWKIFGLVAFAGAGSTAAGLNQFGSNTIWPSYGAGLRIKINKKDNLNIRLDYGIGIGSTGYYFSIAEAF